MTLPKGPRRPRRALVSPPRERPTAWFPLSEMHVACWWTRTIEVSNALRLVHGLFQMPPRLGKVSRRDSGERRPVAGLGAASSNS
jgi:hypothetical protein